MFSLNVEKHDNITIIHLFGDIVLTSVSDFIKKLEEQIKISHIKQYALDLSQVNKIDRAGLGVLINISTKLQGRGRRLVLLSPTPRVAQLLKETEIEGFFPMCDSVAELSGYAPDPTK